MKEQWQESQSTSQQNNANKRKLFLVVKYFLQKEKSPRIMCTEKLPFKSKRIKKPSSDKTHPVSKGGNFKAECPMPRGNQPKQNQTNSMVSLVGFVFSGLFVLFCLFFFSLIGGFFVCFNFFLSFSFLEREREREPTWGGEWEGRWEDLRGAGERET